MRSTGSFIVFFQYNHIQNFGWIAELGQQRRMGISFILQ